MNRGSRSWVLAFAVAIGCGGGDGGDDGADESSGAAPTTEGTTSVAETSGSATTSGTTGLDTTGPQDGSTSDTGGGLEGLGSLVVLGDSISDGGGRQPFYYDLLREDLIAHYGAIEYRNRAQSGSETDALANQIAGLPNELPGPVAVVITSGGNDMKASIAQIVAGTDGPARDEMQTNIEGALAALLAPDRFGAGVEVRVFEGNVYDASDGVGDYGDNGCAFGQGLPAIPTDAFFTSWNGAIRDAVEGAGQTPVDMHAHFFGHGYAGDPNWYAADCTHPNALGHDELRGLFYEQITGEALP